MRLFTIIVLSITAFLIGCAQDPQIQELPSKTSPSGTFGTDAYVWASSAFGACSAICGGGAQSRAVICVSSAGVQVADSLCTTARPAPSQACNTQGCAWRQGDPLSSDRPSLSYCKDVSKEIPTLGLACTSPGLQCYYPAPPASVICK